MIPAADEGRHNGSHDARTASLVRAVEFRL
ncbi:hypothetical protein SMF913_10721 [Streptomyces malaysiensis]|uniref:Uncharacterized protein n=1 Tax=Streptomyces malaysiensis TaxID=92644 RepID=A0A2J7Z347_STRMQ|nr:hypothetical protein SMF913_10721 [Streptomyces malaysiensis]